LFERGNRIRGPDALRKGDTRRAARRTREIWRGAAKLGLAGIAR
jgi:hypothetical protein